MTLLDPLVAAASALLVLGGGWLAVAGLRRRPERIAPPRESVLVRFVRPLRARRTLWLGLAGGLVGFAATGWLVALVVVPLAVAGLPALLAPRGTTAVARLDAMAEWTRSLAGVLTVGVGIEQAVLATLRSCPAAIRPEVEHLASRLRARWDTERALRAFADDLADPTGDLIAAALILGARQRGGGLSAILEGLAESVAEEVRVRRRIEADRAKPRTTARWVTMITVGAFALLSLNSAYMEPYRSAVGQVLLGLILAAFAGALLWMRAVAAGRPLPRFLVGAGPHGGTA
jgi:Flp pilus assembly protein TadB